MNITRNIEDPEKSRGLWKINFCKLRHIRFEKALVKFVLFPLYHPILGFFFWLVSQLFYHIIIYGNILVRVWTQDFTIFRNIHLFRVLDTIVRITSCPILSLLCSEIDYKVSFCIVNILHLHTHKTRTLSSTYLLKSTYGFLFLQVSSTLRTIVAKEENVMAINFSDLFCCYMDTHGIAVVNYCDR